MGPLRLPTVSLGGVSAPEITHFLVPSARELTMEAKKAKVYAKNEHEPKLFFYRVNPQNETKR